MGKSKTIGDKTYTQDEKGNWFEAESPIQKETLTAKVVNGIQYNKGEDGNWYEGDPVKKKQSGQVSTSGGQEKKPAGTPPTQSKSQSQSPNGGAKPSWQTSALNPVTAVTKAVEEKKKQPYAFVSPATVVNVDNIRKYEESQQIYSLADKNKANVESQDEHSIISPIPLIEDVAGAIIPGYAQTQKQKRDFALTNANANLEKTRKNALASQNAIKSEIPKILSPISDTWKDYITYTQDGVPRINEYKIREFANNKSKEYGVQEDGMFYNLVKREASNLVTQKLIQPAVDEQLKINYKKTFGRDLDADIKSENNQAALKAEQLKTNTKLSQEKLGTQIFSAAKEDVSLISTDINSKVELLNNEIKTLSDGINQKFSPLIKDKKFIGNQEQFNEYEQLFAALKQKEKENKKAFDEINKEYLNQQNVIFNKANARYRREAEEIAKIAQSEYEKLKPKVNVQLQKNIEKIYNKSYNEVLNKNQELRRTLSNINSPLTNFTENLLSSLGNQIKGWGVTAGLENIVTFGENLQEKYSQDVTEFKSAKDYLDLQKITKFAGTTTGSMLPGMVGAVAVTYASGGASAPLAWQLISGGLTQWAAETMATAGNIKSDVLAQTGDIAAANNAERQTIQFQKDILPLYAASGLPFIGKGVTKIIGKIAPQTVRATSPTIAKIAGIAENKFVAPLLGGLAEVAEEIPQEYTQNLSEEAIRKEGSYANMWEYHTKEKLQNTVLNVAPMLLFGGVGEMMGQSEADKKEYAIQQAAKSFALKTEFASLAPGQREQFLFDVIQRQGAPFAAAYLTSAYGSGQMDKATFEEMQQTYAKQIELLGKTEELGLTPVQAKLYNAFSTYHQNEKKRFEETEDPVMKSIAAARMVEYENALTNIGLKREPNYSVVTYPDNSQMVFMHSELDNALNQPAFAEAVANGDIKVAVFGESKKLNTKIEESKKAVVATKKEQQKVAKEQEANTRKEIETTFNVEIQDNIEGMGVEVRGLGTEEQTEQAKQALREAGINLREDGTENVTGLPSQVGEGQTVVTAESQQGAGTEATGTGGVLQTQGVSGQVQGAGQGQVAQTTTSPTVVNVSNKTELAGLQQRTQSDKNKSAVLESAKKAIATLKSVFPDMDIFIHEDAESFNQAMTQLGGEQNSRGNFAFGRDKNKNPTGTGRIDINLSNASETTVAHEVTHAVLLKAFGDSPATFKQFRDRMSPILRADLNKDLLAFEKMYEGLAVAPEEYLTQLTALLSKGAETVDYKPSTLRKIAAVINEFVAKITGGKFQPFKGEVDFKNFVEFLNQVSGAIREGGVIEGKTDKIKEQGDKKDFKSKSEIINKASTVKDIDVKSIRMLSRSGKRVSKGLSVKTINNKKVVSEAEDLSIDYVKENAPDIYISNANILAEYPIVQGIKKIGNVETIEQAQEVYDIFVRQVANNLKYLIDNFNDDFRDISTLWYDGANILAQNFSEKYGVSEEQAAGIIAAMSPQKDWYQNVRLAEMVMMSFKENPTMTTDMVEKQVLINTEGLKPYVKKAKKAKESFKLSRTKLNKEKLEKANKDLDDKTKKANKIIEYLKSFVGKKMNSVPNEFKCYYTRLWNEINTTKDYDVLRPDSKVMGVAMNKDGVTKSKVAWGSYTEIGKAVSIHIDGSQENITKALGEMHKIRNFFNNIIDPMSKDKDVTMDTHAIAAALLMPLSGNTIQVGQNFGTGTSNSSPLGIKGLYYAYAEAYNLAAEEKKLLPRQVQSITWEAVRGLFTDVFKSKVENVKKINEIWDKYSEGKIKINEARNEISKYSGGIKDPTWAGTFQEGVRENVESENVGGRGDGTRPSTVGESTADSGTIGSRSQLSEQKNKSKSELEKGLPLGKQTKDYGQESKSTENVEGREGLPKPITTGDTGVGKERPYNIESYRNPDGTPQYAVKRGDRDGRKRLDITVNGNQTKAKAVFTQSEQLKSAINNYRNAYTDNNLIELDDPKLFHKLITQSKNINEYGASVHVYEPKEYAQMRLFITPDGKAGVAIKKDGDLVSGFSNQEADKPRRIAQLLGLAIKEGAIKADSFDTVLPQYYLDFGLIPVAQDKWNEEFKPEGWDKKVFEKWNNGEPDVVYYVYNGGDRATISERAGEFGSWKDLKKDVPYAEYDEAVKIQEENIKSKAQLPTTSVEETTKALEEKISKGLKKEITLPTSIVSDLSEMTIPDADSDYNKELELDIKKNGIKSPIKITHFTEDNTYAVTDGNHRLIIAKKLGIKNIPVEIVESRSDSKAAFPYAEYPDIYPDAKNPAKKISEISEAYHKGDNPELVTAINEVLGVSEGSISSRSQLPEQDKVEKLRAEEQAELDSKIPDAEKYRVDGKVDRDKLTNEKDRKVFDEIYNKYDKVITPLLKGGVGEVETEMVSRSQVNPIDSGKGIDNKDFQDYDGMFSKKNASSPYLTDLLNDEVNGKRGYQLFYKRRMVSIEMMSPEEYLRRVRAGQNDTVEGQKRMIFQEQKEKIKVGIEKGDKIDMPSLSYDRKGDFDTQEGRHRATIAKERGEKLIPVVIERGANEKDLMDKAQEIVNEANKDLKTNDIDEIINYATDKFNLHRDAVAYLNDNASELKTEIPTTIVNKSQKAKVDFGEGQEGKDNKKEFDKLTSTMPNSGEVTKYLSGETIEKYEGEVPRNEQEVVAQQLRPALERGVNIIEKAKELFGDNYVESLLQYVETENLPPANKALIYVSLENEVAKQKLENPSEAAKIEKMQDLVRAKSQAFLRSNSLAINMGRLRKFAEVGYDVNKLTDRFFSSRQLEDKGKIEAALQATADDINKEAERIITDEENIKAKVDEGVREEIQKIYDNLSTDKKKTVDKRLSVLDKIKQNLFNKYTFKSKPQLSEESLKSKSSINNIIEDGYNKIFNAIKAGVDINKSIEIGIDYIKAETEKSTGNKWADEADFRNDITQEFTSQGLIDTETPIKGKTPVDRLKLAKQKVRAQIESLKQQIADKERTKPKDKLKPDAELEALIKQKNALTSLLDKYVPKVDAYADEKNAKAAKAKLEKEILELNRQIQKGQKDKFDKKESQENSDLDVLRAEKEARQAILEALDPTPRLFIENALIEQGFGRQINVKTKNGVEQRTVLDWKKLAGEEGSVDNIRERVEAALRDKGYFGLQLLRIQDSFVEEYNNLSESILEKALNELNARNKQATTPEQKSAARKLVEMYNYGLFDKDPQAYETALAKTLGLSGLSLKNFDRVRELGEALSNLFNNNFEEQPLNESQLRSAIQVIEEKMRVILNSEALQQGGTAFKISELVKGYMDASQRMMLNTVKQGMENPISGLLERFYSSIGYAGTIPEQLNAQQRKMARDIYKEMVLQKGLGYGNVGNAFISKGSLDAYIHNMSDSELVQGIMSVAMGKTILDAVDSAYKAKITQQKFTYNLITILTKDRMVNGVLEKGMTKEEAKRYVAEKISGQSFEDAKKTAKDIIENINTQAGKKIFNDSPEFINRLATDIVNAALVNGEKITAEMVTAAYNAAYKAAGRGLGHVANNPISEQINTISGKLESRITDAIKEKKFAKATYLNLYSIFYRNIANPFVGGGTNWIVLKAEKTGLGLISGLISMYKDRGTKMDLMTETGMKELEDAMYNSMKTKDKFIRGAVGGAVTVLAFMLIKATGADDEFEKWIKKNQWAKKYLNILTPEIMLAMLAAKESGATKKYLESSFNKNEAFDKGKMTIKAVTYLAAGEKEKAAGQTGQLVGASIGNPIPWRLVRDGQQIWVGATGGEPYAINPTSPNTFMEGYLKGGFVDYLGYAPTSEDKSTIVSSKEFDSPEYKAYKDKEIKMPKLGNKDSYEIPEEIRKDKKMTDEEFNKFSKSVKEYELNGWVEKDEVGRREKYYGLKDILNEKYRIKEKRKRTQNLLGRDLPKEDLQNKVNQLHKDAIEKAKKDLGFVSSKKTKRTVTHK